MATSMIGATLLAVRLACNCQGHQLKELVTMAARDGISLQRSHNRGGTHKGMDWKDRHGVGTTSESHTQLLAIVRLALDNHTINSLI